MLDFSSINVIGYSLAEQDCASGLNEVSSFTRTLAHENHQVCLFWDFLHQDAGVWAIAITERLRRLVDSVAQRGAKSPF